MHFLRKLVVAVLLGMLMFTAAPSVSANVRLEGGGNVPFYAAPLPGDEWTAIQFYRPPSCIPGDFNLLTGFAGPAAFTCGPPTTDGFTIWKNGPDVDPVPIQVNLHGLGAVPVWFVLTSEWEAAAADGVVTIGEVEALPSLIKGTASKYHQVAHPIGVANNPKLTITARGTLADRRTFHLHVAEVVDHLWRVRIMFT